MIYLLNILDSHNTKRQEPTIVHEIKSKILFRKTNFTDAYEYTQTTQLDPDPVTAIA